MVGWGWIFMHVNLLLVFVNQSNLILRRIWQQFCFCKNHAYKCPINNCVLNMVLEKLADWDSFCFFKKENCMTMKLTPNKTLSKKYSLSNKN